MLGSSEGKGTEGGVGKSTGKGGVAVVGRSGKSIKITSTHYNRPQTSPS